MDGFTLYILTAFALIFVLEGLIYALFPDAVKRMMAIAVNLPREQLRFYGGVMVLAGFTAVTLLQYLFK